MFREDLEWFQQAEPPAHYAIVVRDWLNDSSQIVLEKVSLWNGLLAHQIVVFSTSFSGVCWRWRCTRVFLSSRSPCINGVCWAIFIKEIRQTRCIESRYFLVRYKYFYQKESLCSLEYETENNQLKSDKSDWIILIFAVCICVLKSLSNYLSLH